MMMHGGERLPKSMQSPVMAYRFIFAALTGTVVTTSAVKTRSECQTLEYAKHVTVWSTVRLREDEACIGVAGTAGMKQSDQQIGNRD